MRERAPKLRNKMELKTSLLQNCKNSMMGQLIQLTRKRRKPHLLPKKALLRKRRATKRKRIQRPKTPRVKTARMMEKAKMPKPRKTMEKGSPRKTMEK